MWKISVYKSCVHVLPWQKLNWWLDVLGFYPHKSVPRLPFDSLIPDIISCIRKISKHPLCSLYLSYSAKPSIISICNGASLGGLDLAVAHCSPPELKDGKLFLFCAHVSSVRVFTSILFFFSFLFLKIINLFKIYSILIRISSAHLWCNNIWHLSHISE